MTYTGVKMFMAKFKQLIFGTHNPLFNSPSLLSQRYQFLQLYEELAIIIQTYFIHEPTHQQEPQEVAHLKTRFNDAAEEAEYIIDLFLSSVHFKKEGFVTGSDHVFKTSLDLHNVMRSIESIKVEFMTIDLHNMKMDSSPGINHLKTQSPAAAGTSSTRNPIGTKKPPEEVVVGHDRDVELIRDKLAEEQKQLDVISIVGMGGLGKTTLATKVFNDPFIVYHFYVRVWVTVSQTYEKRNLLIQILEQIPDSIGVQVDLENDTISKLREKVHKHLTGKRYLIVIDDIWSIEAWDDLKVFLPHENSGSRILLTSRLNEVALHANPHGFMHSLPYLTEEQSWELLRKKVFHGNECPEWLIAPGIQIAKKCQGLPLSLVVMAGVLAKESINKDLWERIASDASSFVGKQKGYLETLALSYHHLPHHLRDCFLYLGGFPEDIIIRVEKLIWLWVAEGFIEEAGGRSLEDTAKAFFMDLIDRNLIIVAERGFDGDVKAFKVHDLVRELCLEKAKEERFPLIINLSPSPQFGEVITPYGQRVFANQGTKIMTFSHLPTPTVRSFLCYHQHISFTFQDAKCLRTFALLRVLDIGRCNLVELPQEVALLVHLRYLEIRISSHFPSAICNLWSLQTLIIRAPAVVLHLPNNISDLVNLRHLQSKSELCLSSIDKPLMNLQSISSVHFRYKAENFQKCFPGIKKLSTRSLHLFDDVNDLELPPYLETLRLTYSVLGGNNHNIRFPTTLKKLSLERCDLPWSVMSIIQSLPNLEFLKLGCYAFVGPLWNTGEEQFRRLEFLRLEYLDIERWEVCSISFPCLKRLQVKHCSNLEEIPLEIGDISTLELLEVFSQSLSISESLQKIQLEQHDVGNYELKIMLNGEDSASLLQEHDEVFEQNIGS